MQCTDDSTAFRRASKAAVDANGAPDAARHDELLAIARRRSSFAEALAVFVREMGGEAPRSGSFFALIRRGLFDIQVTVVGTTHLGDSLLACAEQEERTRAAYRRALAFDWSADVLAVLETQMHDVDETQARVRTLRREL